jgi:hypothetical protein
MRRFPLLALLCLAAGCSRPVDALPSTETASGDTTFVRTDVAGLADTARLAEVWRHRVAFRDEASAQDGGSVITALTIGPDGALWSALRARGVVRVAADGSSAEPVLGTDTLGVITGLAALAGGGVLVRDDRGRVVRLDRRGLVEASAVLELGWPVPARDGVLVDAEGNAWVGLGAIFEDSAAVDFPRAAYLRLGADLAAVDTLRVPAYLTHECPTLSRAHYASGRFEDIRGRYLPKVTWALLPTGELAVGCPAEYAFDVIGADGDVRRVGKAWHPVPVSSSERTSYMTLWLMQMRGAGRHPWGWQETQLASRKPAYQALLGARDGRIWVRTASPSRAQTTPDTWALVGLPDLIWVEPAAGAFDVFERDGRLVGHVELPEALGYSALLGRPDPVIAGDTLWAAVPDSAGWAVARLEVRWP